MPYCTSCGSEIPDGQGRSCSMCYGDVGWGKDGYYAVYIEECIKREEVEKQLQEEIDKANLLQNETGNYWNGRTKG